MDTPISSPLSYLNKTSIPFPNELTGFSHIGGFSLKPTCDDCDCSYDCSFCDCQDCSGDCREDCEADCQDCLEDCREDCEANCEADCQDCEEDCRDCEGPNVDEPTDCRLDPDGSIVDFCSYVCDCAMDCTDCHSDGSEITFCDEDGNWNDE